MLLERDNTCLLLIDVQEKLVPLVMHSEQLITRCQWLMQLAEELEVPTIVSEQYPKGLGSTVAPLHMMIKSENFFEKTDFSCYKVPFLKQRLQTLNKKQCVLIGMETHVCVLQTALDLVKANYDVFVVVDAVSSRSAMDYKYALKRMAQHKIQLLTAEMVFFEWVGKAGTPEFKALSHRYLQ